MTDTQHLQKFPDLGYLPEVWFVFCETQKNPSIQEVWIRNFLRCSLKCYRLTPANLKLLSRAGFQRFHQYTSSNTVLWASFFLLFFVFFLFAFSQALVHRQNNPRCSFFCVVDPPLYALNWVTDFPDLSFCIKRKKSQANSLGVYSGNQKERSVFLGLVIPLFKKLNVCFCCTKLLSFFLLLQAPASEKLPVMYLMDSIVKNVGREYLTAFTKNLVATFICVFEKVYILSDKFCILTKYMFLVK